MSTLFKKADRRKKKLRLALDGPAGSGKTLTALRCGMVLARHEAAKAGRPGLTKMAVIDTESGSASIYQGDVYDGFPIEFDVIELSDFSPTRYSEITREAGRLGYDVLIIDSLSHAWSGKGGALELVDHAGAKNKGNTFSGWKDITPLQNEMIDTITRSSCHVLSTMRTKTEWVLEMNEKGKQVPRKVGMAPVQRQGVEYEFDIVLDIDEDHIARVSKSRCSAIADKASSRPGAEFMGPVLSWLDQGSDVPQEIMDRAGLVDAPETSLTAGGNGTNGTATKPDTVSVEDAAARMARKKAALEGALANATTTVNPSPLVEKKPDVQQSVSQQATTTPTTSTQANSSSGAAAAVTTTATAATTSVVLATPSQQLEISTYFDVMEVPPVGRADTLKKRGANSIAELTEVHAGDLLAKLRGLPGVDHAKVVSVVSAAATGDGTATTAATAATTATAVTASGAAPISDIQQDRIRRLFEQLQVPDEARVMAYQKRGVNALVDMTSVAADDLTLNLLLKLPAEERAIALKSMELEAWADRVATGATGK